MHNSTLHKNTIYSWWSWHLFVSMTQLYCKCSDRSPDLRKTAYIWWGKCLAVNQQAKQVAPKFTFSNVISNTSFERKNIFKKTPSPQVRVWNKRFQSHCWSLRGLIMGNPTQGINGVPYGRSLICCPGSEACMSSIVNKNLNIKNILTLESIMESIIPVVINRSQ